MGLHRGPSRLMKRRPVILFSRRVIPLLREKVPLFAIALVSCIITYIAQQKGGAVESLDVLSLSARLANSFISYAVYIGKMFWPNGLAILYPHPGSWPVYDVVPAVLLFAAITAAVVWAGRKWPYLPSGWFWYCGTLVPVIGIVQAGLQARADRFTYIPLVGLFIIAAWGAPDALKAWRWRKQALAAASAGVLACFFAATWVQVGYWKDDITVYNHALAVTAPSGLILNNRGSAYSKRGDYQSALKDFDRAAQISPAYADPLYNRGVVHNALGDYPRAMADFSEAIRINPQYEDAYNNRGIIRGAMGDYKGAIEDLAAAVSLNPQFAKAYYNRGSFVPWWVTIKGPSAITVVPWRSIRGTPMSMEAGARPTAGQATAPGPCPISIAPLRSTRNTQTPIITGRWLINALATGSACLAT